MTRKSKQVSISAETNARLTEALPRVGLKHRGQILEQLVELFLDCYTQQMDIVRQMGIDSLKAGQNIDTTAPLTATTTDKTDQPLTKSKNVELESLSQSNVPITLMPHDVTALNSLSEAMATLAEQILKANEAQWLDAIKEEIDSILKSSPLDKSTILKHLGSQSAWYN